MVYNLLASFAVAQQLGSTIEVFQKALDAFDPQNGRLQHLKIEDHAILMNLAKNSTGFNQNIQLIMREESRVSPAVTSDDQTLTLAGSAVAFFVNDREGDGRDVSWLWDVNFEELAILDRLKVFVGGSRKNDVRLRLKYAGIPADMVEMAKPSR